MTAVALSPVFNGYQGFSPQGIPLAGGQIFTYAAGSSTPAATYTDAAGTIANTNPIVLGADGRPPQEIWLVQGSAYLFTLKDALNNQIGTYDNISGSEVSGTSAAFQARLADPTSAANGAGLVGFGALLSYAANTVGNALASLFNSTGVAKVLHIAAGGGSVADYPLAGLQINKPATVHAHYGVLDSTAYDFTSSVDPIIGSASFNDNSTTVGSHVFDHHHSFQSDPHFSQTVNAGIISSFWSQFDINLTTGSINELSGVKVNNPTGTGSGTVSSFYGVLIGALTRGLNNWGIFVTGPTPSFFGGPVNFGSLTTPYASIQYEPTLGHLMLTPRPGFAAKVGALAGDQKLRIGLNTADVFDVLLENATNGDFEVTARAGGPYCVAMKSPTKMYATTVATLTAGFPPASVAYARAFVTDATATTFASVVAGGGANRVPVWCDGTNWRIG